MQIRIISIILLISQFSFAQNENLSEQELQVIKTYQFNLVAAEPLLVDVIADSEPIEIPHEHVVVDLLPLDLKETNYAIKPLAHQPESSKFYKGYALAEYGNLQNMNLKASYMHMVPNYYMYGITGGYNQIKDVNILDKQEASMDAQVFIRYFLSQKTWIQYKTIQNRNRLGVFGFNTTETISSNTEKRFMDVSFSNHQLSGKSHFDKWNIKLDYDLTYQANNNVTNEEKEEILKGRINMNKAFKKGYTIDMGISNDYIINPISINAMSNFTKGTLGLSLMKSKVGFKTTGTAVYTNNEIQLYPNVEFYLQGKNHTLTLAYRDEVSQFTYGDAFAYNNFVNTTTWATQNVGSRNIGLSYKFNLKNSHNLELGARRQELVNAPIFINSRDEKLFDVIYQNYNSYVFDVAYEFRLLSNLSFLQSFEYTLLDNILKEELLHIPTYQLESAMELTFGKFNTQVSYRLDDKVFFSSELDYMTESDYGHNVGIRFEYNLHEQVRIHLTGNDLINNQYERLAGYKGFGRNYKIGVTTKF